ncbi:MAG: hypothetical protein MUC39_03255 [Candidatus Omnitrophica bacterium]|jgi:hypothetical protein|nr:hypothetical protein [Candidatus Omnitrophota bacterium]
MKKSLGLLLLGFIFVLGINTAAYTGISDIAELVDTFQKATDLQRNQILQDNLGQEISTSGIVSNVSEYNFFNTASDSGKTYFQASTELQKTKINTPYEVIFLFKDKDKIKDINKGWTMQQSGKIIRILDERLQITVWLLCADLTEDDKTLFSQTIE